MEMIDNLYLAFLISALLFLWNHTDFFVEYCNAFGFVTLFKVKDYGDYLEEARTGLSDGNPDITYLDYLLVRHDSFLVRLIVCPICLGVWLNILSFFLHENFYSFCINLWLSLFLYFIIKLVMRKSDV